MHAGADIPTLRSQPDNLRAIHLHPGRPLFHPGSGLRPSLRWFALCGGENPQLFPEPGSESRPPSRRHGQSLHGGPPSSMVSSVPGEGRANRLGRPDPFRVGFRCTLRIHLVGAHRCRTRRVLSSPGTWLVSQPWNPSHWSDGWPFSPNWVECASLPGLGRIPSRLNVPPAFHWCPGRIRGQRPLPGRKHLGPKCPRGEGPGCGPALWGNPDGDRRFCLRGIRDQVIFPIHPAAGNPLVRCGSSSDPDSRPLPNRVPRPRILSPT